jgi:phosphatidylglycerophosphate synthase
LRRSAEDARLRPGLLREALAWSVTGGLLWIGLLSIERSPWGLTWWAVVAAMLLTHLGMVEGEDGSRRDSLGAPNALTLARAWCVPALPLLTGQPWAFATVVALATASDVLDGRLARAGHNTRLGAQMDHGVDIAFTITAVLSAAAAGWAPWWLAWLVVARYALPVLALAALYFATARQPPREAFVSGRVPGGLIALGLVLVARAETATLGTLLIAAGALAGSAALALSMRRSLRAVGAPGVEGG